MADPGFERRYLRIVNLHTISRGVPMLSRKILKSKVSIAAFQSNFLPKYLTFLASFGHGRTFFIIHHWNPPPPQSPPLDPRLWRLLFIVDLDCPKPTITGFCDIALSIKCLDAPLDNVTYLYCTKCHLLCLFIPHSLMTHFV